MTRRFSATTHNLTNAGVTIPQAVGSFGVWVYPEWASNDGVNHVILEITNGFDSSFSVQKAADNSLYVGWYSNGDYRVVRTNGNYTLNANVWNHIGIEWNDTTNVSALYINGVFVAQTATLVTANLSAFTFNLGNGAAVDANLAGRIGRTTIWNHLLGAAGWAKVFNGSSDAIYTDALNDWPLYDSLLDPQGGKTLTAASGTVEAADPPLAALAVLVVNPAGDNTAGYASCTAIVGGSGPFSYQLQSSATEGGTYANVGSAETGVAAGTDPTPVSITGLTPGGTKLWYRFRITDNNTVVYDTKAVQIGTVYFFANAGNNANSGLTALLPKQTIAHANSLSLVASDWLTFKKGDTFNDDTLDPTITYGPLTISSYGSGALPIFPVADGDDGIAISDLDYVTVNGVDVQGSGVTFVNLGIPNNTIVSTATGDGIKILNTTTGSLAGPTITNCKVSGLNNGIIVGAPVTANTFGFVGVTVSDNEAHDNIAQGVRIGNGASFAVVHDDVQFLNNKLYNNFGDGATNSGYGAVLCACSNLLAEGNLIYDNGAASGTSGGGPCGILGVGLIDSIVRGNVIIRQKTQAAGGDGDGQAIDIEAGGATSSNFVIEGNAAIDCHQGITVFNLGGTITDVYVRNNIVQGSAVAAVNIDGVIGGDFVIHNNTIHQTGGQAIKPQGGSTVAAYENNLIFLSGGATTGTTLGGTANFVDPTDGTAQVSNAGGASSTASDYTAGSTLTDIVTAYDPSASSNIGGVGEDINDSLSIDPGTTDFHGLTNEAGGTFSIGAVAAAFSSTSPPVFGLQMQLKAEAGVYSDAGTTPAVAGDLVRRWSDQTGNGNHANQATSGHRPRFDGTLVQVEELLQDMSVTVAINQRSFSLFMVADLVNLRPLYNGSTYADYKQFAAPAGGTSNFNWNMRVLSDATNGRQAIYDGAFSVAAEYVPCSRSLIGLVVSVSNLKLVTNADDTDTAALDAGSGTSLTLFSAVTDWPMGAGVRDVVLYNRPLSAGALAALRSYAQSRGAVFYADSPDRIVIEGDSISVGVSTAWPHKIDIDDVENFNESQGGITIVQIASETATRDTVLYDGTKNCVMVVFAGTNDIAGGATGTNTHTALANYCTAKRSEGWKVVVVTMLPRTTFEVHRGTFNTLIRANWATYADGLADVAADARIGDDGDNNDLTYYSVDAIHPNAAGHDVIASIIGPALQGLLTSTDPAISVSAANLLNTTPTVTFTGTNNIWLSVPPTPTASTGTFDTIIVSGDNAFTAVLRTGAGTAQTVTDTTTGANASLAVSAATTYEWFGPSRGRPGTESSNFTVQPNGIATGNIFTPTSPDGVYTPTTVTGSGTTALHFTYTPTGSVGDIHTLSISDSGTLPTPADLTYTLSLASAEMVMFQWVDPDETLFIGGPENVNLIAAQGISLENP